MPSSACRTMRRKSGAPAPPRPRCCATGRRWSSSSTSMVPTVVIVGAGFGGLRAARALARAPVRVVLIDRNNYHLFQPLLYQVAMAGLEPSSIARPVRRILRGQKNFAFHMAHVTGIDRPGRVVHTSAGDVPYDY